MCDPLTIAGAALAVGGAAANSIASSQVESATNRALVAERARQQQLRSEAAALQESSRKQYDGFDQSQAQRAQELGSYLQQNLQQPQAAPATAEAPATSSNITTQEETRQREKAGTYSAGQATALGNLRSFGDILGTFSRQQARDAGAIGQIGGFMQGSSGVLPLELDAAAQAGNGMKTLGALASGAGKLSLGAGLSGSGPASIAGLFGSGTGAAATGLPSIAAMAAAPPATPLTIGAPRAALPTFARSGNIYSAF